MIPRIPRREFLQKAGLATAASLYPAGAARPAFGDPAPAKDPRLFSGCCAYSYRQYLTPGKMTMEEFILKAIALRIDGVDITTYYLKSTQPDYLYSLRHLASRNGIPFSGAAVGSQLCQSDPDKRAAVIEEVKKWVDVTDCLGTSHLRVFGNKVPPGSTAAQQTQWIVESLKAAGDYAGKKGITLGLETHGGPSSSAQVMQEILHQVDSPYVGCNLDITHFHDNEYAQIQMLVPYATHTHIRDHFDSGAPIDLDRVWQMFAKAGYKGYMSAEYEGKEDPSTGVPKLVAKIKDLCHKYSSV